MYVKMSPGYVDPKTGAPLPDAVLVITDAQFSMRAGLTTLQLALYATPAAAVDGSQPISETSTTLSPEERAEQAPALLQACYTLLLERPELAGATLVP
jgi:hypothetical protein